MCAPRRLRSSRRTFRTRSARRSLFDPTGETIEASLQRRCDLRPGAQIAGPAIITEDETSTVVSPSFEAHVNGFGYIELRRRG
jgi:N-methylhydantoinase A